MSTADLLPVMQQQKEGEPWGGGALQKRLLQDLLRRYVIVGPHFSSRTAQQWRISHRVLAIPSFLLSEDTQSSGSHTLLLQVVASPGYEQDLEQPHKERWRLLPVASGVYAPQAPFSCNSTGSSASAAPSTAALPEHAASSGILAQEDVSSKSSGKSSKSTTDDECCGNSSNSCRHATRGPVYCAFVRLGCPVWITSNRILRSGEKTQPQESQRKAIEFVLHSAVHGLKQSSEPLLAVPTLLRLRCLQASDRLRSAAEKAQCFLLTWFLGRAFALDIFVNQQQQPSAAADSSPLLAGVQLGVGGKWWHCVKLLLGGTPLLQCFSLTAAEAGSSDASSAFASTRDTAQEPDAQAIAALATLPCFGKGCAAHSVFIQHGGRDWRAASAAGAATVDKGGYFVGAAAARVAGGEGTGRRRPTAATYRAAGGEGAERGGKRRPTAAASRAAGGEGRGKRRQTAAARKGGGK
ncbi:hypothetical protein cyc_08977 [Cyclospora cayetanensis]|uniref:Uncharacterized protein n=1 Tax=Cyclospora cayetanensis TaxID=88456 RepID=A0A1D3D5T6_9EIME|nr:hypothetical protein cyc_08977 [Cyclospora cayetanensis]